MSSTRFDGQTIRLDDLPVDINAERDRVHAWAKSKGWWDPPKASLAEECVLFHSEVAEAVEEYRNGHHPREIYYNSNNPSKPEGIPIELADVLIRVLDSAGYRNLTIKFDDFGYPVPHDLVFYRVTDRTFMERMREIHSAIESVSEHVHPSFSLSRIVALVLHVSKIYDIDIWFAYEIKMAYNQTREHRHGGKKA